MSFTTIILAGGDGVPSSLRHRLPRPDLVIAADSGYRLASQLGLAVDLVVGDFDSLDPGADLSGIGVERHPTDKDHSDLELALLAAKARGATAVVVVGGAGGRLDHLLANAAAIGASDWASVVWLTGNEIVYLVRRYQVIEGRPGDLITLLAVEGDAHGVTTTGLRFSLNNETLLFGTARGLSNVMEKKQAEISLESGTLLAVHVPLTGGNS